MAKFKFGKKDPTSSSSKSRAILFFFVVVLIVSSIIGYIIYKRHMGVPSVAGLTNAPGIESIPGVGKTSTEYVKLQEQQNVKQAQVAEQSGTSAVPTITRTSYFGPSEFQAPPGRPGCNPEELRRARNAGVRVEELRCKGCSLTELRAAGYTAGDLAAAGYSPADLARAGYSPGQLRQAGLNATELKAAGFTAGQLAQAGFDPAALAKAGFNGKDIGNAGFNSGALTQAGIGTTTPTNMPKDCSINSLRNAHAQGIPAVALRKMNCGAAALRAAGYTAADLRAAGFTPEELRAAGYSPADLKSAGFTAGQLRRAGFGVNDLKNAGFTPADFKNAGVNAGDLTTAGFSPDDLKTAGYTPGELLRAGYANDQQGSPLTSVTPNCSIDALRLARAQGISAADIKKRGCTASAMLAAGYTPAELKAAGFTDDDLRGGAAGPNATSGPSGVAAIPSVGSSEAQLAQLQANQEQQLSAAQRDQRLTQVQSSMVSQANALFNTWTPPALQQYVAGEQPKEVTTTTTSTPVGGGGATTTTTTTAIAPGGGVATIARNGAPVPVVGVPAKGVVGVPSPSNSTPGADEGCADVKAGDIMMAVLTSTVNSDENSPVMATVVSGKLRGAKLIGQFTLLKKKVLINFTKMDMPGKPASIGINAVAIDPETAHTALADCVNNHYWLRYGTLFASSFLSGLADAISQQGSQVSTGAGGILVTHDPLSTGQTLAVALGAVGSQYASVLGSNFTRPPTVYVYDGDSIGVLFMQDLTLTDQCCSDVNKTCGTTGQGCVASHY